jgi:hypothetical protein
MLCTNQTWKCSSNRVFYTHIAIRLLCVWFLWVLQKLGRRSAFFALSAALSFALRCETPLQTGNRDFAQAAFAAAKSFCAETDGLKHVGGCARAAGLHTPTLSDELLSGIWGFYFNTKIITACACSAERDIYSMRPHRECARAILIFRQAVQYCCTLIMFALFPTPLALGSVIANRWHRSYSAAFAFCLTSTCICHEQMIMVNNAQM